MALIKNDVSDQDIENLFDHNNTEGFQETQSDDLIPEELDATKNSSGKIERPDEYQANEVHQKKLLAKKQEEAIKKSNNEQLLRTQGSVTAQLFNQIAKVREQAQLEEYIAKQRKLPRIDPSAKLKLYNDQPCCKFHVFQVFHVLDNDIFQCTCKFCSQEKLFSKEQWKQYELENRQYM